jgi:hypothetical protein
MGNKDFKDLKSLFARLNEDIAKSLKREVAKVAREAISETVIKETYEQYQSSALEPYERTGELANIKNMQVEIIDDNTISITNERYDGGVNVAEIVATGIGYSWKNSEIYNNPFPRNFYEGAMRRLDGNGKHIKAMEDGLIRMGYKLG